MTKIDDWYLDRLRDMLQREDSVNWMYRGLHVKIPCTHRNALFCLDYLTFIKPGDHLSILEIAERLGYDSLEALSAAIEALPRQCELTYPALPSKDRP